MNDNPASRSIDEGIEAVSTLVARYLDPAAAPDAEAHWQAFAARLAEAPNEVPLAALGRRTALSDFELRCLLLAVAVQLEPNTANLVRDAGQLTFSRALTVRLALDLFATGPSDRYVARQTFAAEGRLVSEKLVALGPEHPDAPDGLLTRRFEVTQPALRYLLGEVALADTVARFARLERPTVTLDHVIVDEQHLRNVLELVENHGRYRKVIGEWGFERILPYGRGTTLLFSGPSGTGKTLLAQALATHTGRPLLSLSAADLPEAQGVDVALRDLFAEAALRDAILLIDECDALFAKRDRRLSASFQALEEFTGVVVLITNHPDLLDEALERRILYHFPMEVPDAELRERIWMMHLPAEVPIGDKLDLRGLAARYDFSGGTIKNAVLFATNRAVSLDGDAPQLTSALLEEGCRSQLRYKLEALTERHTTKLRLDSIVLPERQQRQVEEVISACRNQTFVLNQWGFGDRLATGKGITVLFDGAPGTGKTLCAEIIAGELGRPLNRINIPEVVSKWVGETEKNIREIFRLARISHSMLLFDEADALFSGRVTEVRSSNDRYANMEVNLLLQEIERFPGVCILTTNHFGTLDAALVRRIQFRVRFDLPDVEQRRRIWETLCPAATPRAEDVDFGALAKKFEMSGGEIKNALLRAAYRSADQPAGKARRIEQATLVQACRDECAAAGKVVRDHDDVDTPRSGARHKGVPVTGLHGGGPRR